MKTRPPLAANSSAIGLRSVYTVCLAGLFFQTSGQARSFLRLYERWTFTSCLQVKAYRLLGSYTYVV